MMKKVHVVAFIFILFLSVSCVNCKNNDIDFGKIGVGKCNVVVEDIPVKIPGDFIVLDSTIVICDPLSSDFILMVFKKDGRFLFSGAAKGYGPADILTPSNLDFRNGCIGIFDLNLKKHFKYRINLKDSIIVPEKIDNWKGFGDHINKAIELDGSKILANGKMMDGLFCCIDPLRKSCRYFGSLNDIVNESVSNFSEVFQGSLRVDEEGKYIAYAAFDFPYVSLYKINDNRPEQKCQLLLSNPSYDIKGDKLQWKKDNIGGFMDLAIGNQCFYLLHSNLERKDALSRKSSSVPKILYEFDFSGKGLAKYDLEMPLLRITCDKHGKLYGIAFDEGVYKVVELVLN
ncbi:hypothetical protein DMA11_18385 [Marinilabiliaceae bacterium JC017]|nr:hypothetical protein DMA11_18385 [Marinilabiliaceae bacterium JC017]